MQCTICTAGICSTIQNPERNNMSYWKEQTTWKIKQTKIWTTWTQNVIILWICKKQHISHEIFNTSHLSRSRSRKMKIISTSWKPTNTTQQPLEAFIMANKQKNNSRNCREWIASKSKLTTGKYIHSRVLMFRMENIQINHYGMDGDRPVENFISFEINSLLTSNYTILCTTN